MKKKIKGGEEPNAVSKEKLNEEDFYSAISESASKLIIHYGGLMKKILAAGDMPVSVKFPVTV